MTFILFLFLGGNEIRSSEAESKGTVAISEAERTENVTSTARRRRRRYIPPKKMHYPKQFNKVTDTLLAKGVTYKKIVWGGKYKHHIHCVEVDLPNADVYIKSLKATNLNTELETLQNIVKEFDSLFIDSVLVAVNANFWKAYTYHPIGPTIVDGELVEMKTHKNWTSGFFTADSRLYIDNFFVKGTLATQNDYYEINYVNRRKDSTGIVLYNQYAGNIVPYVSSRFVEEDIKAAINDAVADLEFADSTDLEIDSAGLAQEIIAVKQSASLEYNLFKISCNYITGPAVNKTTKAVVTSVKTGAVAMPLNGFIISFGNDFPLNNIPGVGDTVNVTFYTDVHSDVVFYNSVSGTPRLIRKGKAKHEAKNEDLRSRRFINMQLPRTAIGTNKEKTKVYIVAVEGSALKQRIVGASLWNLTKIMEKLGCYDAMNLDGGGSSVMVIGQKNVLVPAKPYSSRRISVGLGVILDK